MKTRTFILAGMVAACLAACTSDDNITDINSSYVDDGKSIKVEVTDEFAHAATRADYSGFPATEFEEGDQIGVYAVNTSNAAVASNIAFTRQSDGSWTPASSVAYNPDYTYYAYFPYKSSTPSFAPAGSGADGKFTYFLNDNTFWVADQSSKANFTTSNLMWAEGTITGERTVKFTMAHKRGLAIISPAVNQWYYSDDPDTKYNLTTIFSTNIPYELDGTRYFLMKPNTATTVGGMSLRAGAGKYMTSAGVEMTGNSVTYQYSTDGGSSFSTAKPSWLKNLNVVSGEGEPTMFSISTYNMQSTDIVVSNGTVDALSGKPTLSNVDLSMVDNAGNPRASRTTANCYLVHNPGTYKIPLVYGNAIKNGETNSLAYHATESGSNIKPDLVNHADAAITDPWLKNNSATPDGAELLWQDVNGMITAVGIDGDFLTFTVAGTKAGNAVIAAKMGSTIVWSWHIWVTDETLSTTTAINAFYNNSDDSHIYNLSPVNLGWVSEKTATVYQGASCIVRATCNGVALQFIIQHPNYVLTTESNGRNPFYQWGRKDPEIPMNGYTNYNCNTYDISGNAVTTSSVKTITTVTGSNSIGATIQNPHKHYYCSTTAGPYNELKNNYWDINQNNTSVIITATIKTVYDPCPPGFCVPTDKLFFYMDNYSSSISWVSTSNKQGLDGGSYFSPANGQRGYSNSQLSSAGTYGYWWSASASAGGYAQGLLISSTGYGSNGNRRACGNSVRPVLEE